MYPMAHRGRRLHDTLLVAVHRVCDGGHLDVAARLLRLTEEAMAAEPDIRRRRQDMWTLIAAYERLWHLRYADADLLLDDAHAEGPASPSLTEAGERARG
jgi:hypothetical protein